MDSYQYRLSITVLKWLDQTNSYLSPDEQNKLVHFIFQQANVADLSMKNIEITNIFYGEKFYDPKEFDNYLSNQCLGNKLTLKGDYSNDSLNFDTEQRQMILTRTSSSNYYIVEYFPTLEELPKTLKVVYNSYKEVINQRISAYLN